METPRRHPHVLRHRAVQPVAKTEPRRAEVVPAGPALHALAANLRGGLADDAIAVAEAADAATRLRDGAAELVAEHHRHVDAPRVGVVRLVDVRTANRYGSDRQQHVVVADVGNGNFAELDRQRLERVVNEGGVGRHRRQAKNIIQAKNV